MQHNAEAGLFTRPSELKSTDHYTFLKSSKKHWHPVSKLVPFVKINDPDCIQPGDENL